MCKSYRILRFNGPCSIMMKVVHDMICVSFVWIWAYQILSICFKLDYLFCKHHFFIAGN